MHCLVWGLAQSSPCTSTHWEADAGPGMGSSQSCGQGHRGWWVMSCACSWSSVLSQSPGPLQPESDLAVMVLCYTSHLVLLHCGFTSFSLNLTWGNLTLVSHSLPHSTKSRLPCPSLWRAKPLPPAVGLEASAQARLQVGVCLVALGTYCLRKWPGEPQGDAAVIRETQ